MGSFRKGLSKADCTGLGPVLGRFGGQVVEEVVDGGQVATGAELVVEQAALVDQLVVQRREAGGGDGVGPLGAWQALEGGGAAEEVFHAVEVGDVDGGLEEAGALEVGVGDSRRRRGPRRCCGP